MGICLTQELINNNSIVLNNNNGSSNSDDLVCEEKSQLASELCSFNGDCYNSSCYCYHGWAGSRCQFCTGKVRYRLTYTLGILFGFVDLIQS